MMTPPRIPRASPLSLMSSWTNKTLQLAFLAGGLVFVLLSIHIGFVVEQRQQHGAATMHSRLQRVPPPLSKPISPSSTLSKLENKATTSSTSQRRNDDKGAIDKHATTVSPGIDVQHEMAPKNRLMFPKFKHNADNGNQQQQQPVLAPTLQSPNGGAFVHMGKTGGSAISLLLRNGCHSWMPHPCRTVENETIASRLVQSYYHSPDFPFLQQSHHDFYIISIRDPLARFISAFCFEHIDNRRARHEELLKGKRWKYEDLYVCFPTLEKYVSYLEGNSTDFYYPYKKNQVVPDSCQALARASFHGFVRPYIHLYFNYQRIKSFIPHFENATIHVIRQEHLWDDWKSVNRFLINEQQQQQHQRQRGHHHDHHHPNNNVQQTENEEIIVIPQHQDHVVIRNLTGAKIHQPVTRNLSEKGLHILCHALEREYQAYFSFLLQAKNLATTTAGDHDEVVVVKETIHRARQACPNLPYPSLTS